MPRSVYSGMSVATSCIRIKRKEINEIFLGLMEVSKLKTEGKLTHPVFFEKFELDLRLLCNHCSESVTGFVPIKLQ